MDFQIQIHFCTASIRKSQRYFYHQDHLGSNRFVTDAVVDPDGKTGKKFLEVLSEISKKYDNLNCGECGREMVDAAQSAGVDGKLIPIETPALRTGGGLWSNKAGKNIGTGQNHYNVDIGGKVVDNHTSSGVPRKEYLDDLHHRYGMEIKDIELGAKAGYEKAKNAIASFAGLAIATKAVIGEEVEETVENPAAAVFNWTALSDVWDAI